MPPPPAQRTSNASSWWERAIVKRSTHAIQSMVDTMMEDSHFLQQHEADHMTTTDGDVLLSLHRNTIQTGALLGKGSFSVVLEVRGVTGDREPEHDCTTLGSTSSSLSRQDLQNLEGRFAIKHLRPDLVQKPEMFQAAAADLLMEAKYLSALNHPGILKLRAVAHGGVSAYEATGGQYDSFFLITDRLHGTLKDKIMEWQLLQQDESLLECIPAYYEEAKEDPFTSSSSERTSTSLSERLLQEKLDIAQQIASALEYMHSKRLIFRDLKPPNVGMTTDNRVQLFDFGFCRELPSWGGEYEQPQAPEGQQQDEDDSLYYMSGKGSLMYLAPEVLQNGRYNRKADCYSFAMVLYELLSLNKPFHSVNGLEVFRELLCKHKARPPLEYSDIPLPLQDLLRHSWDSTVRERWTMRKIHQRLKEISQELDPSASHPATSENDQQVLSSPIAACGSGLLFDLVLDFAKDLRLGYDILSGNGKVLELSDQQQEKLRDYGTDCRDEGEVTGVHTAATEDSSLLSFSAHHSLRITPMTATEEPLEVTLEEAGFMSPWNEDEYNPAVEEEQYQNGERLIDYAALIPCATHSEEEVRGAEELRCPPSPFLQRTTSAPAEQLPKTSKPASNVPLSPHYPERRQSMGSVKGFSMPEPDSPHYPPRRQSTGGTGFFFPESYFLPTAAELRG